MSKGLGKLQRLIVAELSKPGGETVESPMNCFFVLPESHHDLRRISKELAQKHVGLDYGNIPAKWHAAFSRAIRGLRKRGLIEWSRTRGNGQVRYAGLKSYEHDPNYKPQRVYPWEKSFTGSPMAQKILAVHGVK
jgi:hypothetical protein